jgi:hypothetical protein
MRAKSGSQQKTPKPFFADVFCDGERPFLAHPEFSCKILVQRILQSFS